MEIVECLIELNVVWFEYFDFFFYLLIVECHLWFYEYSSFAYQFWNFKNDNCISLQKIGNYLKKCYFLFKIFVSKFTDSLNLYAPSGLLEFLCEDFVPCRKRRDSVVVGGSVSCAFFSVCMETCCYEWDHRGAH